MGTDEARTEGAAGTGAVCCGRCEATDGLEVLREDRRPTMPAPGPVRAVLTTVLAAAVVAVLLGQAVAGLAVMMLPVLVLFTRRPVGSRGRTDSVRVLYCLHCQARSVL
ncbi:hypothetical protein ACIRBX_04280 [Kitasatospora sp. NPDC096147]|uniref:hypothetical protein n=1 Tax=Kitasatospora sp. NPDC096147 TaxID=3364093 RepID=UPI0038041623